MGIYPDHGIEYHIVLKDQKRFVIANTKATDDRLRKSKYLDKRYEKWFDLCRTQCIPLKDVEDLDVELDDQEKERLQDLLNINKANVLTYGWYDVCSIYDTYGDPTSVSTSTSGYYVILKDGKRVRVGSNKELGDRDQWILNSILNVYGNDVDSHGFYDK